MNIADKKAYILDVAKSWNYEDKEDIAKRWNVKPFSVCMVARNIAKKIGLSMRSQRKTATSVYTEDFLQLIKENYR